MLLTASCSPMMMGLVVGLVYLLALVSLILDSIRAGLDTKRASSLTFAALSLGWLLQVPLATITTGEHGFMFWALKPQHLAEDRAVFEWSRLRSRHPAHDERYPAPALGRLALTRMVEVAPWIPGPATFTVSC